MYSTIYELGAVPAYAFWHCGFFVVMGLGVLYAVRRRGHPVGVLWGIGALLLGGIGIAAVSVEHISAYRAYKNRNFETIEGIVHVVSRQPHAGHAPGDHLEVNGRTVEVNYFDAQPGYHTTLAYGGALDEGTRVRLAVSNGRILRLEVGK
jgi:hypothetical protein